MSTSAWLQIVFKLNIDYEPRWCSSKVDPDYCPFPENVLYEKSSHKAIFDIPSYQNKSYFFDHLENYKNNTDEIKTFLEYVDLIGVTKMLVKISDLPTIAFPLN